MHQNRGLDNLYRPVVPVTDFHLVRFYNFGCGYRSGLPPGLSCIIADFKMNPPAVFIFRAAGANHPFAYPHRLVLDGAEETFGQCAGFTPGLSSVFRRDDVAAPFSYVDTYLIIKL